MSALTAAELLALVQGSPEWEAAKVGYAGASEFALILAKGQGKPRAAVLRKMVAERLTRMPQGGNRKGAYLEDLARGKEQEQWARMSYAAITGFDVEEVGIIRHAKLACSCSPDGLVGVDRGVEIKSVIPTVQIETILAGGYPSEHRAQIQGSLWITGRSVWDFCSYSETMPENLRTYIFPVVRDEAYIAGLAAEVQVFLDEVDGLVDKLREFK